MRTPKTPSSAIYITRGNRNDSKNNGCCNSYDTRHYDSDWWDVGGYDEAYPGWSDDS